MLVSFRYVGSIMAWEFTAGNLIFEFAHDTPLWLIERAIAGELGCAA